MTDTSELEYEVKKILGDERLTESRFARKEMGIMKPDESCWANCNTIKTREDAGPYHFVKASDETGDASLSADCAADGLGKVQPKTVDFRFCGMDSDRAPWGAPEGFSKQVLHDRIEPWLTALFQSEHLSLLLGSGLSVAVDCIAGVTGQAMEVAPFETFHDKIEKAAGALAGNRGKPNCEDRFRAASELLQGLRILGHEKADDLEREISSRKRELIDGILKGERGLACADATRRNRAWNTLVAFLMSFASRTGTRDRLGIFTTNYDRIVEEAADLAGLHLLDRFTGMLSPVFRASRLNLDMHYNPPGIRGEPRYLEGVARYTKLHGSLDWVQNGGLIRRAGIPFGVESVDPYLKAPGLPDGGATFETLIYPTSAKDRETAEYPFVDLFRDFAAAVCQPNGTVVTYGYGFGDDHINRVLEDMLTIPSTHLVIISFDHADGRISRFWDGNRGRSDQITLLVGRELGDLETLTREFLPKSAIDFVSSRMSELLSTRYVASERRRRENSGDESLKESLP